MPNPKPPTPPRESRLSDIHRDPELLPLRRAKAVKFCRLYWIPVARFPMSDGQKKWLLAFLEGLTEIFADQVGLRCETFLEVKPTLNGPLTETLAQYREELFPILGLSRRPKAPMPKSMPTQEEIDDLQSGKKKFSYDDYMADYTYWFLPKTPADHCELTLGHGGVTQLFLEPDPEAQAPQLPKLKAFEKLPLKSKMSMDEIMGMGYSLKDGFQDKSKELFAPDLADHYQVNDCPFVIPKLGSQDFFNQPEEERDKWFELFGGYVRESVEDKGLVVACAIDIEAQLIDLLIRMREEGWTYPEG